MCGRYTLLQISFLQGRFTFTELGPDESDTRVPFRPRYNIAPSQQVPVVVTRDGTPQLRAMTWGYQPAWFKPSAKQPPPINARAETLIERPMFRGAVSKARCAIPADGFYEWRTVPGERRKQPMYIRLKGSQTFLFAGLYTWAPDPLTGEERHSCAIVTTAPNELMAGIHNRMPVILADADADRWLDSARTDPLAVLDCLGSYPAEAMDAYAVGPLVSSVRNDGPALIMPLSA